MLNIHNTSTLRGARLAPPAYKMDSSIEAVDHDADKTSPQEPVDEFSLKNCLNSLESIDMHLATLLLRIPKERADARMTQDEIRLLKYRLMNVVTNWYTHWVSLTSDEKENRDLMSQCSQLLTNLCKKFDIPFALPFTETDAPKSDESPIQVLTPTRKRTSTKVAISKEVSVYAPQKTTEDSPSVASKPQNDALPYVKKSGIVDVTEGKTFPPSMKKRKLGLLPVQLFKESEIKTYKRLFWHHDSYGKERELLEDHVSKKRTRDGKKLDEFEFLAEMQADNEQEEEYEKSELVALLNTYFTGMGKMKEIPPGITTENLIQSVKKFAHLSSPKFESSPQTLCVIPNADGTHFKIRYYRIPEKEILRFTTLKRFDSRLFLGSHEDLDRLLNDAPKGVWGLIRQEGALQNDGCYELFVKAGLGQVKRYTIVVLLEGQIRLYQTLQDKESPHVFSEPEQLFDKMDLDLDLCL